MFTHYRTSGFVLKKENIREADVVFTLFTKDFGRVELLARAGRKIKSKLRGGLQMFSLAEVEFIQGKAHKTIICAKTLEKFGNLRNNLCKLAYAYQVAHIFDKLIKGQEQDERIWQIFSQTFKSLNQGFESSKVYSYFVWHFLDIIGYHPEHLIKQNKKAFSLKAHLDSILIHNS